MEVKLILKELIKLQPKKPTLSKEGAVLFDGGEKMRQFAGIRNHHRLSEHGTAFGASDIEDIAELSQIRKAEVIFRGGKGIGQPG